MTRYFFVVLLMGLVGIAIVVKGAMIMFAERQYWHDVADRFVKENVTVKPNRGNILSSDGKLMASSLPEYKIYMDFMSGERDEKRRKKDQQRKDSIWKANFDSICIGLHQIFPDISAATFKSHLRKGREMKSRNYNILPNRNRRISYIQYKEAKRLPVFKMNKYRGGFHEQIYNQRKKPFGSLAAQTLGRLYADTAMGARRHAGHLRKSPGRQVEGNQCQRRGSRTDGSGYRRSKGHCQHDESRRRQLLRNEQ